MPFKDGQWISYEIVLLMALQAVLEQKPYYWQAVYTDDHSNEETMERSVVEWMKHAHAFVADISDLKPDVMMKLVIFFVARSMDSFYFC